MRRAYIFFPLCFVLLHSYYCFAQPIDHTEGPKPPPIKEEVTKPQSEAKETKPIMDGLTLLMGVYSPFHGEMKGIYGSAFSMSGQYCFNMGNSLDLLASIGFMKKSGNPYYDVPTFSSGSSSTIQIIPMEISLRRRMVFMKSPSGFTSRGFYAGAGINYIRAKEQIPGILTARGGDFGMQIFAGPQMFLADRIAFEAEVKLLINDVDMKDQDEMYPLTLSGLVIRAALSWYY